MQGKARHLPELCMQQWVSTQHQGLKVHKAAHLRWKAL